MRTASDRVRADRRFAREHHGVRAVENRVCHVGSLCPRWTRRGDHRFEHLRCRDDGLAGTIALCNDLFLNDRHGLDRHFGSEIAARDHDAVGAFDDAVELDQRLVFFDLGDDRNALASLGDKTLDALDVRRRSHKRDRNVVNAVIEPKGEVFEIERRHRGDVERALAVVDALRGTQGRRQSPPSSRYRPRSSR